MTPPTSPPPPRRVDRGRRRARAGRGPRHAATSPPRCCPTSRDIAYLLCKEDAVVCGRPWFDACHRALDPDVAHRLARRRRRPRRAPARWSATLRRPHPRAGQRRARGAQFPADAERHRHHHRRLRRRRRGTRRAHPRHAQDHPRPAPGAEVRGARRRRRQPPHRPVRRGDAQGKPHARGGLDRRRRSAPRARCIRRCR